MGEDGAKVQKSNVPIKKVFSSQMDEKSRKELCYHYAKKWNLAHIYKSPKVYMLHGEDFVATISYGEEDSKEVSIVKN